MKNELTIDLAHLEKLISKLFEPDAFALVSDSILSDLLFSSGADFALLAYRSPQGECSVALYDPNKHLTQAATLPAGIENLYDEVYNGLKSDIPYLNINDDKHPAFGKLYQLLGAAYLACLPSVFEDKVYGFIILGRSSSAFSDSELGDVKKYTSLSGIIIRFLQGVQYNRYLENKLAQKQKLETIGKIAGGIAHDISNILSSIFGSVAILKRKAKTQEDVLRLVGTIERGAIRAKDLTKNLLSYGKSNSKLKEIVHPEFLIHEISRMISDSFPPSINLKVSVEDKLEIIHGNSTQLFQVLLNLCMNAKEAMNDSGILELEVKNLVNGNEVPSRFPLLGPGNYIQFSVKDNGKGIREENLGRIFDPFFSTKPEEENSGLGLYIVYGIVKAHQGHIEVKSKPGLGTHFDIFIPAMVKNSKPTTPAAPIILIADDEVDLCDLLGELLESYDYYVLKVQSGEDVLRIMLEEIKIDLLIIDFNMPGLNGLETLKRIREMNYTVPVILSTGSTGFNNQISVTDLNINSIIHKPYDFETMLATIRELL